MTEIEKLRFCKGDWLAIAMVILLAVSVALCFLPKGETTAAQAQIYMNGQLVKTVSLYEEQMFWLEGTYSNQITVTEGTIAITASDCPGQDCVHSGSIRGTGRSLVCLPNGVEIRVVSAEADVDFVVG